MRKRGFFYGESGRHEEIETVRFARDSGIPAIEIVRLQRFEAGHFFLIVLYSIQNIYI